MGLGRRSAALFKVGGDGTVASVGCALDGGRGVHMARDTQKEVSELIESK